MDGGPLSACIVVWGGTMSVVTEYSIWIGSVALATTNNPARLVFRALLINWSHTY